MVYMTLQESMKRFNNIEKKVEKDRKEYMNLEARFEVQEEDYRDKKKSLKEKGLTFKNGAELKALHKEKEDRLEEILIEMEKSMGIIDTNDDDDDDDDDEEFDLLG